MTSRHHMRPRLRPDPSSFLVEIFAVSAAALVLEISYTRIISFKLYYYYTYLVIGLALLGLGSGAVLVAVSRQAGGLAHPLAPARAQPGGGGGRRGRLRRDRRHAARHPGPVGPGPVHQHRGRPAAARHLPRPLRQLPAHRHDHRHAVRPPARPDQPPLLRGPGRRGPGLRRRRAADGVGGADRRHRRCGRGPAARRRAARRSRARQLGRLGGRHRRGRCVVVAPRAAAGAGHPHRGEQGRAAGHAPRPRPAGVRCSGSTRSSSPTTPSCSTTGSGARRSGRGTATPRRSTGFDTDDRSVPFAALGAAARAGADHRRRRRQRDPGRAPLRRGADRRRRAQPGDRRPAARAVTPTTRATSPTQPGVNYVLGDGRSFLAESDERLRPDLVRRARQLRGLERGLERRVRAVRELPLHAGDDGGGARPPHRLAAWSSCSSARRTTRPGPTARPASSRPLATRIGTVASPRSTDHVAVVSVDGRGLPVRRLDHDDEAHARSRRTSSTGSRPRSRRCQGCRPATCPVEPATTRAPR